ncbi:regulator of g protein signaling [Anaeramoeba flamelloides]|uniref:Regulator of g protein signaling n=1 Tax=Anaeramoeba flamelloides TaxID=1746091 RepID=A0AAV7Z9R8_9EUKA|nr:regulator of g protein signaling [Anaeramoeba flamelloides]
METERIAFFIFAFISVLVELTLYYHFMKRRRIPLLKVRSATLTSIFTFSTTFGFLVFGFIDSEELIYSCYGFLMVTFLHETFTTWLYICQAWRINFIYLMNKHKLKSIKRFIKNVKTESNISTSKEPKTPRFNEEYESSVLNSTVESHFWEGIIEEGEEEGIDKKFEKVERKFYQKRTQISGKYMFYAILIHFIFMILMHTVIRLEGNTGRKADGICEYGQIYRPLTFVIFLVHILLFSYYLFKIWKIKDNFKIRNQLYMIFLTCILTALALNLRNVIKRRMMWQWPFAVILIIQYLIVLGYPLWLSRKSHTLTKEREKNKKQNTEETVEKFTQILNDKNKSKYFSKYLQLDYSIENLLFYQAVSSFEKINPNKKKKKKKYCEQIIKTFVHFNARLEVNLEHSTRTSTIELAEKDPTNPSCFKEAKNKIFFLMFSGSYPNFLFSKQYYEMMIDIDQLNIDIGGERDIQLNPLKGDGGRENENEMKSQSKKDINKESENESKNENGIKKDDENSDDHNHNQSNPDSENSDQNKTQSEISNPDSYSD